LVYKIVKTNPTCALKTTRRILQCRKPRFIKYKIFSKEQGTSNVEQPNIRYHSR